MLITKKKLKINEFKIPKNKIIHNFQKFRSEISKIKPANRTVVQYLYEIITGL